MKWLFCVLLLSGCSTLSEKECLSANWSQLGIRDGQRGASSALLELHRKACARYAIIPEDNQYLAGRAQGLTQYCEYQNAFRLGWAGREYTGVCASTVDVTFRRYHAAAFEVYRLKTALNEVERHLAKEEHELMLGKDHLKHRHEIRILEQRRLRLRDDLMIQQREVDRLIDEAGRNNSSFKKSNFSNSLT